MEAAPLVTLIAVGLAIAVIAAFLITVVWQLYQVYSRLNTILGVVGGVIEKTAVLEPILAEISADLAGGQAALDAAVERLKARQGYGQSEPEPTRDWQPAGLGTSTAVAPPPSSYRNY